VLIDRRAEWQAWLDSHGDLEGVLAHLRGFFGADAEDPVETSLARDQALRSSCLEFARLLGQGTDGAAAPRVALEQACGMTDAQAFFDGVRAEVLKNDGRADRLQARQDAGEAGHRRCFAHCVVRTDRAVRAAVSFRALRSCSLDPQRSRPARRVGELLEAYDRIKRNAGVLDFGDLEWHASRLLSDAQTGPFVQARLDARYRHLLLDEFQDTNPLQWQVLMHWLDAYAPGQVQPAVFVVGDPKQSIYRFRRADPRIFAHAGEAFAERFGAIRLQRNETRRSSPAVVQAVNALFGALDVFRRIHAAQHGADRSARAGRGAAGIRP
jgi:ATP-dependent helicase/nuclease subunit A